MQIRYTIGTNRADDWICTSICRQSNQYCQNRCLLSRATSASKHEREESNPVEQFWRLPALPGAHSCKAAHRTMSNKGIRRELNPCLLVHSQACSNRYTTDTHVNQQPDQDLNPELHVRTVGMISVSPSSQTAEGVGFEPTWR
jgi:hypothetical protein